MRLIHFKFADLMGGVLSSREDCVPKTSAAVKQIHSRLERKESCLPVIAPNVVFRAWLCGACPSTGK